MAVKRKEASAVIYEKLVRVCNAANLRPIEYELMNSDSYHSGFILTTQTELHKIIICNDWRPTREKTVEETVTKTRTGWKVRVQTETGFQCTEEDTCKGRALMRARAQKRHNRYYVDGAKLLKKITQAQNAEPWVPISPSPPTYDG